MRPFVRIIFFFVALLAVGRIQAQVYPVQGNSVLIPPYSVYLADYTEGASDRFVLNLVLNDVTRPELRVRFRTKIIGQNITVETKPEYIGREIILQGGIPLRLTGAELTEYFDPNHLNFSGISRKEFEKTGALPAGFYQFCFEVLEYNRGAKISNTICANGWLILNDPPIINLPRNGEKLTPTQPQNLVFQWTPRHTGSPNSAFTTEYDIKLVELWPVSRNPNDAILTSPPILEVTTQATTFIYDVSQTPLEPGRHYALQVRARSTVGADELDLFKNNGKSEVVTFVYGDACKIPQSILAEATSSSRFSVKWSGEQNHTGYSLRYRLADNPTAEWYTSTTLLPDAAISGLQPNTAYEYQVAGKCSALESAYSGVARIKTLDVTEQGYACGIPLEPFNLDPANLLETLRVGDIIKAGDFDVKITEVSGSNGTFSGEGVIEVPFFNRAKVKAEFSEIVVNKELRMVNGYLNITGAGVEVVPSALTNLLDQLDETVSQADTLLGAIQTNIPEPFEAYAFVPDTTLTLPGPVIVNTDENGNVIVTDANGTEHRMPAGTEAAVVDGQGSGVLIDSKGNAHTVTASVAEAAGKREYKLTLAFAQPTTNQAYGFDAVPADAPVPLKSRYDKLKDDYYIPYKSIEAGRTDFIAAQLDGTGVDKSKIRFELGGSQLTASQFIDNSTIITLTAAGDGDEQALVAILPAEDESQKDQILGRAQVVTYSQISKTVHIVPVNGNDYKFGSAVSLQQELNKIYAQAVVSWSVQMESAIQVEGISPFDVGETGLLSNYTDHMKAVIRVYKEGGTWLNDENHYYLFLVSAPSDPDIAGYMPRGKQAGFIFYDKHSSEKAIVRTMAHELGHGAFNLHHTFMEEDFSLPEKATDNLMDYAGGVQLYKYQWDKMRYPPVVIGLFEGDGEEEYVSETDLEQVARIINTINCGFISKHILADVHYGRTRFEVNLGKLASLLNAGAPILVSEEFRQANLLVWFGGYFIDDPYLTYNDISLKLNEYKYVVGEKITIPGVQGGAIGFQVSNYGFRAPLKRTDVFDWLVRFLNRDGSGFAPLKVDNTRQWKAEDLFTLSECELLQLSRANRERLILEIIGNQENALGFDKDTYQYLLINLLKYTPESDKRYFYAKLCKNSKWALYPYRVMDLDQRHKFMDLLVSWWSLYSSPGSPVANSIVINYSIFSNPNNLVENKDDVLLQFKSRGLNNVAYYVPESVLCSLAPLNDVQISFKDQAGERKVTRVPAILVKYMVDKGSIQDLKDLGWTALNAASLVTGIGEVGLAIQTYRSSRFILGSFRFLLATGNIFSSIASTYCTSGRSGSEFCKTWAQYELLLSVGLLSASALDQLYAKLSKAYKELPPGSFTVDQKKLLEDELGLADDILNNKILYPTVRINGVPVVRLLQGTNNKIAIIGRKMEYVRQVASDLRKLGKEVELFEKTTAFNGQGYRNLAAIEADWQEAIKLYGEKIPYDKLKKTLWYQENQRWAKWLKQDGYDVYDLGDNPGMFVTAPDRSAFYDIEKIEIFGDKVN